MEDGVRIHRKESSENSWRRSPVEEFNKLIINPWILDPDANWQHFLWIYNRLVATKSRTALFWDIENPESISLPSFLDMFKKGGNNYIIWVQLEDELIGFFMLKIHSLHKCFIGIWIEPRWRGPNTVHFFRQIIHYIHNVLNIKHIYGYTPWNAGQQLASRSGMTSVAILPSFCIINGKERDVEVFHSSVSSWTHLVTLAQQGIS